MLAIGMYCCCSALKLLRSICRRVVGAFGVVLQFTRPSCPRWSVRSASVLSDLVPIVLGAFREFGLLDAVYHIFHVDLQIAGRCGGAEDNKGDSTTPDRFEHSAARQSFNHD